MNKTQFEVDINLILRLNKAQSEILHGFFLKNLIENYGSFKNVLKLLVFNFDKRKFLHIVHLNIFCVLELDFIPFNKLN